MRILRIIPSMNPNYGGPSQGIRNSIPYMQEAGIVNEVVCLDDSNEQYGVADNFKIYKLGRGKTSYQYHSVLRSWLKSNLKNYTHVVVHGIWQFPNYAVYKTVEKLKRKSKLVPKIAIMPHGMLDPYFQKAKDRKLKALRNEIVWRLTEQIAINNADALLFTCEEELNLARTTFKGYMPKREINVGYGIQEPPEFSSDFKNALGDILPNPDQNFWLFFVQQC